MAAVPPGMSSASPQLGPRYAPAGGLGADPSSTVLQEIARDVGQQVEMMILKAKHMSETKVSQEIHRIKQKMEAINEKIKLVHEKLSRLDRSTDPILKVDLQRSIDKLEEVWEGEVGTLKHELWQTIQAHNHNADLMKHHKEAIDQVQSKVAETAAAGPELQAIQEQLMQVDRLMQREQTKQQQIDQFMNRLATVQQQLALGPAAWSSAWGAAAAGMGLPGVGAVPPAALAMPQQMAAMQAAAAASKKAAAATKKTKAKPAAKAPGPTGHSALPPSMRAEAPEFVPNVAPFDGSL